MNLPRKICPTSRICGLILILLCGFLIGWGNTWESVRKESQNVRSLQADFIQKKKLEILSEPLISKGEIFFEAPGSLRFEYTSPVRSITLVHEDEYKKYTQAEDGLTRDSKTQLSVMRHVLDEISLWLQGKFKNSTQFNATLKPDKRILLTPKTKVIHSVVERIELQLSQKPGLLKKVIIFENKQSRTELIFKNASLNNSFKDSLFQEP